MPLVKSKSPKAFKENIRAEVKAGKPVKQAVAIAYDVQRRAKKMAVGGAAEPVRVTAQQRRVSEDPEFAKRLANQAAYTGVQQGRRQFPIGSSARQNYEAYRNLEEAKYRSAMGGRGAPVGTYTATAYNPNTIYAAPAKKAKGGDVSLAVGRGEKLPADRGAGLTQKGREKYNRETGSNLKAPQPEGGPRRDSFCARMGSVARKSERGSRARASMKRWNCPGW